MQTLDREIHSLMSSPEVAACMKADRTEAERHALLSLAFELRLKLHESSMVCALAAYGALQYLKQHPELLLKP